jgi:uncharacterized protein
MELALQVVGLKMTGKLEDAKSVAMRIVGPANEDTSGGSSVPNAMQLSTDSISLGLRSALHQMGPWSGLEKMVIDLLSLLDVEIDTPFGVSLERAMEHKTSGGQTLLHLAAFLQYPALVNFLINHDVDKDAQDHNGNTALHLASLVGAQNCAAVLLDAGADVEIANVEGKRSEELADFNFADLLMEDTVADEESRWGDGEDSGDEPDHNRASSRRVLRRSVNPVPTSPLEDSAHHMPELAKEKKDSHVDVDEKRAATFMRKIQRTLARVQPKDGIILNMPYLALPQLLQLPGMPGVPWGALPTVFPAYVPSWTGSLRNSKVSDTSADSHGPIPPRKGKRFSLLTPQEWRTFLEKSWQGQQDVHDSESPPVYTPRAEDGDQPPVSGPSIPTPERPITRQVGYDTGPAPDDQVVNSYQYLPRKKEARQIQNKGLFFRFGRCCLTLALILLYCRGSYALPILDSNPIV